ncbi:MAG TPA: hypothetical protein VI136_18570 [Verrucomicrobiae bacterium]
MKSTLCVAAAVIILDVEAAVITFDFTGTNPGLNAPWTKTSALDPNVSLSTGFSLGSGLTGNTANNRFNAKAWQTDDGSQAISGNDYLGFVIAPNAGYVLDLNSASVSFTLQTSWNGSTGNGPKNYALFSSVGGFVTGAALKTGTVTGTETFSYTFPTTGYDGLSGDLELRIYGWNAVDASGTMSVNAFSLGGQVVPEPVNSALALFLGVVGSVWGVRQYRKRRSTELHDA